MSKGCECTSRCGDDPNVVAGRVLGCESYRRSRNPAHLQAVIVKLRDQLAAVVHLLDRMEPEVPEEQRASDDEWIATKADANRVLDETA